MSMGDMPTMVSNQATSMSYAGAAIGAASVSNDDAFIKTMRQIEFDKRMKDLPVKQPKEQLMSKRRVVRVYISDSNENVPLSECILYKGDEQITDSNDQELFFEIDVKGLLENHNEKRVKIVDKKVKDRTEYLEPAKVRDLKMTVTTLADL